MASAWNRLRAAWDAFEVESRKRWYLFAVGWPVTVFIQNRLSEFADWLVRTMNASGLIADAVRGLVGPIGFLAVLVGFLFAHAYFTTGRVPAIRISGTGTVTPPAKPTPLDTATPLIISGGPALPAGSVVSVAPGVSIARQALASATVPRSELAEEQRNHQRTKEKLAAAEAALAAARFPKPFAPGRPHRIPEIAPKRKKRAYEPTPVEITNRLMQDQLNNLADAVMGSAFTREDRERARRRLMDEQLDAADEERD
jgi:hypothetical protein